MFSSLFTTVPILLDAFLKHIMLTFSINTFTCIILRRRRLSNARVTCEARPASAGWRDSCKLHGRLTFFVELFCLFVDLFRFTTLQKESKNRDKAQVKFTRLFCGELSRCSPFLLLLSPFPRNPFLSFSFVAYFLFQY